MAGKKKPPRRRVVRRVKKIPKVEELYAEAYKRGMTVYEYVNWLNSMNADKTGRRNRSTTYDMGPIPYRKEKDEEE